MGVVKPRLRHVAERAGVSQATVSRVLNDRPGVSGDTRRDVLQALADLGYEPTGLAPTTRTRLVGLIVPELDNPVFPRFAQALESGLASEGYTTVLCTSTPAGKGEPDYLEVLIDHAVSGIVIVSGLHADMRVDHGGYRDLAARRIPTVVVNGRSPKLPAPSVTVDHLDAVRQSVAHLASFGHERIGLAMGPRRYVQTEEVLEGYRQGLEQLGLPLDDDLVSETLYGFEGGRAAGSKLLRAQATGVVCASDQLALGIVQAARDHGLSVPDDLSVVGFDDAGPNAFMNPPLTSIRQPFDAMASAVVTLLTGPLDLDQEPTELRFRPELIVRGSTGRPRRPDEDRVART